MKFIPRFIRHKLILKFIQKATRSRIAKNNSEKEEKGVTPSNLETLYSYSNQDHVVLAEGQTHRSMEQKRESRNGSTQTCPTEF